MIDRAIGIIGIALALLTLALQYYFPQLPAWAPRIGFGAGIFLFGVSIGLIAAGGLRRKRPYVLAPPFVYISLVITALPAD